MAPVLRRSSRASPRKSSLRQSRREDSWEMLATSPREDIQMTDQDDPAPSIEYTDPLDPLRTMADRVGFEVETFAVTVDNFVNRNKDSGIDQYDSTLQLVSDLKDVAEKTVETLRKRHGHETQDDLRQTIVRRVHGLEREDETSSNKENINDEEPTTVDTLRYWQQEADTWALLETMLRLEYDDAAKSGQKAKQDRLRQLGRQSKRTSDADIWERFLLESEGAMEKEKVLRWLEMTADASPDDINDIVAQLEAEAGHGSNWSDGWLYTRQRIKREKRRFGGEGPLGTKRGQLPSIRTSDDTSDLITQLDPDATSRQQRNLEKEDKFTERSVWLTIWEMLRRGKPWEEIRTWCDDKNEGWRAISMGVASFDSPSARTWVGGVKGGALWRMVCYAASQKKGEDEYQQAIYGLLGGNFKAVEPVCRSSDDFLYAHYQASLLKQFDRYLRATFPNDFPSNLTGSLSRNFGRGSTGADNIDTTALMAEIQSRWMTRSELASPLKAIQTATLSHNLLDLLEKFGRHFGTDAPAQEAALNSIVDDAPGIRVASHVAIILKGLGCDFGLPRSSRRQALEHVIIEHILQLAESGKMEAVPTYVALLSEERGWNTIAPLLLRMTNQNEQITMLRLLENHHLDIGSILYCQYQYAMAQSKAMDGSLGTRVNRLDYLVDDSSVQWPGQAIRQPHTTNNISRPERDIIRSVEWYKHVPAMWCETFDGINNALVQFLLTGRTTAAYELCLEMPYLDLSLLKTGAITGHELDILEVDEDSPIRPDEKFDVTASGSHGTANGHDRLSNGTPNGSSPPHKRSITVREMQRSAGPTAELQQMVATLDRIVETGKRLETPAKNKQQLEQLKDGMEDIGDSVEALMEDFLSYESLDQYIMKAHGIAAAEQQLRDFQDLRTLLLPELVLIYIALLHRCGYYANDVNYLLKVMDMAPLITDSNPKLLAAFKNSRRVGELVEMLGACSKALLRLQGPSMARKNKEGGRDWDGRTTGLWDPSFGKV